VGVLQSGGVVVFPTETFYGLAADPSNRAAIERLLSAKGRPSARTLPLVVGSMEELVARFPPFPEAARLLAKSFWPGPLTLALPAPQGLHEAVVSERGGAAVRVPGGACARALAQRFGGLLTATSANRSGMPPARRPEQVDEALAGSVSLLLDGGETPGGLPSTVIDLTVVPPALVREGALAIEEVERVLGIVLRRTF
jgi:L-threonylcarbamoyladenylate synthase